MQSFKTAVLNMSACALFGSLAELLSVRKNAGVMRAVTAALIIVMSAASLSGADIPSIFPDDEYSGFDSTGNAKQAAALLEKKIYADIENLLISEGLDEYEIYIDIVSDEKLNTVSLEKITVLAGREFESAVPRLRTRLGELYACAVTVGVKQNE